MGEPTVVITIAPASTAASADMIINNHPRLTGRWALAAAALVGAVLAPSPLDFFRAKLHSGALRECR